MVPNARVFLQRIHRDGQIIEAEPTMVLAAGDVVAVSGRREVLVDVIGKTADEVEHRELLDVPAAAFDVLVTNKKLVGRTLEDIVRSRDGVPRRRPACAQPRRAGHPDRAGDGRWSAATCCGSSASSPPSSAPAKLVGAIVLPERRHRLRDPRPRHLHRRPPGRRRRRPDRRDPHLAQHQRGHAARRPAGGMASLGPSRSSAASPTGRSRT